MRIFGKVIGSKDVANEVDKLNDDGFTKLYLTSTECGIEAARLLLFENANVDTSIRERFEVRYGASLERKKHLKMGRFTITI